MDPWLEAEKQLGRKLSIFEKSLLANGPEDKVSENLKQYWKEKYLKHTPNSKVVKVESEKEKLKRLLFEKI
jgi:hypothetical protein